MTAKGRQWMKRNNWVMRERGWYEHQSGSCILDQVSGKWQTGVSNPNLNKLVSGASSFI